MRDRVERPHQPARAHVERAQITGRGAVALARGGPQDDQVLEHLARRAALDVLSARDAFSQVDSTAGAERLDELSGARVDLAEEAVGGEDDATVRPVGTLPIVEPAVG